MKRSLDIGERIDGRRGTYEIRDELPAGGFAKPWVATTDDGERVCVKHPNFDSESLRGSSGLSKARFLQYFDQEREILSSLQSKGGHTNVVDFIESFTVDDLPIIVVELVEGRDGYDEVNDNGAMDPETVRSIGVGLSAAAQFIHRNEHINRDLKPENFILRGTDTPVLVDFNTARGFDPNRDPEELDPTETRIQGHFKPPEVEYPTGTDFRQGPWSDVYSIGMVLFFLLVNDVPKRKHGLDPRNFVDCPDYLAGIIETATQEDYADRYQNAETLKLVLENEWVQPPATAELVRQETGEHLSIQPGDTIGNKRGAAPATIRVSNPDGPEDETPISSVQVEFDIDADGNWTLRDRSLNGTWVHRGVSEGWRWILSSEGRSRLKDKGYDPTLPDGSIPPTSAELHPSDRIALVDPTFGVTYTFDPE